MPAPSRTGARGPSRPALWRRLAVAVLGLIHLSTAGAGALVDAPPAGAGHQQHIAAESTAGCQTYHDEHCVVCRVISADALGPAPAPAATVRAPAPATLAAAGDAPRPGARWASPPPPRAPPLA